MTSDQGDVTHKLIYRAYKTELRLNNKKRTLFKQCAGLARFAYNWGLRQKMDAYEATGKRPSYTVLNRSLNALKKSEFAWIYNYSSCIPQEALLDLERAFQNYFRQIRNGEKAGPPRFKSRKQGVGSFRLKGCIRVEANRIKLPKLGWFRLKEKGYLPLNNVKILWATISERAGRWFVSLQVQEAIRVKTSSGPGIGIDLGISSLATCSNGITFANPLALQRALKKLARLNRELFRRQKGSCNRQKTRQKLARLHYRIACIRRDAIHQVTSAIIAKTKSEAQRPAVVVLEDLNVAGLIRNRKVARAISDVGLGQFRQQIAYKCDWYGSHLHLADRWFASSKQCSRCGHVKEKLSLSQRIYQCSLCGLILDRDLNAARNLALLTVEVTNTTASPVEGEACGDTAQWSAFG